MKKLTERQQQILDLIRLNIQQTGMPPTRAEIASKLGFRSANAAEDHLRALERKGVLNIIAGTSRGLQLVQFEEEDKEPQGLPLIGRVAAGEPLLAVKHIEEYYPIDSTLFKPHPDFLLRVKGSSMKNAGIIDGDLVAIHRTQQVRNGQIVVARIEDEVTVKRWHRQHHLVTLYPENDDFTAIVIDLAQQSINIEGIVVGLIRQGFS